MIRKVLIAVGVMALAFSCSKKGTSTEKAKVAKSGKGADAQIEECMICKKWIHAQREDAKHVAVYKTEDSDFVPVRGLEAMAFSSNGTFRYYVNGKTDRPFIYAGKWSYDEEDKNIIYITWKKGKYQAVKINEFPTMIEIIELTENMLTIKK